jgi:transcriptional regulator with XRE-family HTH domain
VYCNNLKETRTRQNLSQLEVSRRSKIAPANISALERGKQYPFPGWKKRLSETLGVSEAELFPELLDTTK